VVRRWFGERRALGVVAAPVLQFVLAGVVSLVIVGLALSIASRRIGEREGITDARSQTLAKAQNLVEPALTADLLDGDPAAVRTLDRVVRADVLDDDLVRVKIWRTDGTILYSDEPRLIGAHYELGPDEQAAIRDGQVEAEVSELDGPENRFERSQGKLLEVYLPLQTPGGEPVLFESYSRYETVEVSGRRIWRAFAPFTLGSLVALQLVQIPLAWSLARKLRIRQLEREDLLERAVSASDHERRRIAQDLHDGVVQDLAGVSYSLAASSRQDRAPTADEVRAAAATVRSSIEALRTLVVEIYPPNLADEVLGPALADLLGRSRASGLEVALDTSGLASELPDAAARLVYRTVQEAMRNVVAHADASVVTVTAASDGLRVWAEVTDDGRGFDVAAAHAAARGGHVGLLGLSDLAGDAGGELSITSSPGAGTTVHVEVPLP
jgi:two-component system, NarL family, sensor kinase